MSITHDQTLQQQRQRQSFHQVESAMHLQQQNEPIDIVEGVNGI